MLLFWLVTARSISSLTSADFRDYELEEVKKRIRKEISVKRKREEVLGSHLGYRVVAWLSHNLPLEGNKAQYQIVVLSVHSFFPVHW